MNQLLLILISIIYGFISAYIFSKINKYHILILLSLFILTIIYIYIIYLLNNGSINYILKINIILGWYLYYKSVKFNKKSVKL